MYLPTVPITFQLKHVDRSSTLELETDFLPLLPRQDPPVGDTYVTQGVTRV